MLTLPHLPPSAPQNFTSADPRELADQVAESELAAAIAWTRFYLDALRERQNGRLSGTGRRTPEFHHADTPAADTGEQYPLDLAEHS